MCEVNNPFNLQLHKGSTAVAETVDPALDPALDLESCAALSITQLCK